MDNKLDSYHQPVTGRNILRFALPTMVMTVFNRSEERRVGKECM